jgi:hypothetical protein
MDAAINVAARLAALTVTHFGIHDFTSDEIQAALDAAQEK